MHPRTSLSAISTFGWELDRDLEFYADAGIDCVGDQHGEARPLRLGRRHRPHRRRRPAGREPHRARAVPARRPRAVAGPPGATCSAPSTRPRRCGPSAWCSRPGRRVRSPWDEAADALEEALGPVLAAARARDLRFALEHTNSLRVDVGFVHTLRDAVDLARRLDVGVCMEVNACWAERDLAATVGRARRPARARAGQRLRDRHARRRRPGWSPATATSRWSASSGRSSPPATKGASISSSSAPRSTPRGTRPRRAGALAALGSMLESLGA